MVRKETSENKQIFRKKSIERISSPEQLNEYIKVASPESWIVIIAIVILLIGIFVWAIVGSINVNTENGPKVIAPIELLLK